MPFQSEKQRRFLHANHPEIAKRWERDYANGGILDIDASEEIISDDGNDIELTDYNAAFDEPTGVKSLFQAKDGGRIGYQWGGPGGKSPGTSSTGGMRGESNRERGIRQAATQPSAPKSSPVGDYRGQHDWDVVTKPGEGDVVVDIGPEREEAYEMVGGKKLHQSKWGVPGLDPRETADNEEDLLTAVYGTTVKGIKEKTAYRDNRKKAALELAERNQKAALNKWGLGQLAKMGVMLAAMLAMGVPFMDAIKAVPKTVSISKTDLGKLVKESIPVMKAKKEYIAALTTSKQELLGLVDVKNPNEMKSEIGTLISDRTNEIKDLTPTPEDDDTQGDGGIELPPQLGGPSTEEMATQYQDDWYGAIKEKQAQQKAFKEKIESEKLAREGNPIVSGTETDIIALRNSGGLANLFRVKNQ